MRVPAVLPALALPVAILLAAPAAHAQAREPYRGYGVQPPYQGGQGNGQGYDQSYGQGYDQGYGQPGPGYDDGYGEDGPPPPAPAPRGGASYRDDERWSGGDSYGTADARPDAERDATAALNAREASRSRPRDPRAGPYAQRIARWRARADACEAGDVSACRGPD